MAMQKEEIFQMLENTKELLSVPQEVLVTFKLLNSNELLDVDVLADFIEKNAKLSSIILERVNIIVERKTKNFFSVHDAVVFLGAKTVRNFLVFFIMSSFYKFKSRQRGKREVNFNIWDYWLHVLGTSIAADMLMHKLGQKDDFQLFSYGLLHDIGILVMDTYLPEQMDEIYMMVLAGTSQIVAEKVVLGGITHSDIGAWLCEKWHMSDEITNIVKYHHTVLLSPNLNDELRIIYLANIAGTNYYEKLLGLEAGLPVSAKMLTHFGLTLSDLEILGKQLPAEIEKYQERFSAVELI